LKIFSAANSSHRVKHDLVNVAPTPVLAGLERLDDRMMAGVKVFRRVSVWRRVAAANVAAGQAKAQVQPDAADAQAVFTTARARCHRANLIKM